MNDVFYFTISALIVIIIIYIILKLLIKKFNPEKSKVRLYGLMQGMTNSEIVSISSSIINYIFMIYLIAFFVDIDIYNRNGLITDITFRYFN